MFLVSVQFEVLFSTWKNSGFKTVSGKVNVIFKTFLKKLEKFDAKIPSSGRRNAQYALSCIYSCA